MNDPFFYYIGGFINFLLILSIAVDTGRTHMHTKRLNKQIEAMRKESEQDFNRLIKTILHISGHAQAAQDLDAQASAPAPQTPQRRKRGEPLPR